ncbi:MAG: HAD-IIIC family phosphatase [Myxococcales bacterium]|nr:HAD-IIIC family phosphatase [Myxococcales bacterium]
MKLADALRLVRRAPADGQAPPRLGLASGLITQHLETFLGAHVAERTGAAPRLEVGLFDDLAGTIRRFTTHPPRAVAVVLEWSDLDPRLGYRITHGLRASASADVVATVEQRLAALTESLRALAEKTTVALLLPLLPLPPRALGPPHHTSAEPHRLRAALASFAASIADRVRVLDPERVATRLPAGALRFDTLLGSGSPYTLEAADALGALLAEALHPTPPRKGLITDLDDTLWRGLLGDDGIAGLSFDLDHGSHAHALYQELLAALAEQGVLLAIVSKNDPALVDEALHTRTDLVVSKDRFFPIKASWGPKSQAVAEVLAAWNVAPDAVTFVDDSPRELEEVSAAFPTLHVLRYPTRDDEALLALLRTLQAAYGKTTVTAEDALRLDGLRNAGAVLSADLLAPAEAEIEIAFDQPDARALELVNKTNQWNLDGRRLDEATFRAHGEDPARFLLSVSYRDKFGPLGKIAVLMGRRDDALVDTWVMSCRAFSRHVEHHTLRALFDHLGVDRIRFGLVATERNGPLREFLGPLLEDGVLTRARFEAALPTLHAKVTRR